MTKCVDFTPRWAIAGEDDTEPLAGIVPLHRRLNLTAPINTTGYGIASTNLLVELVRAGHEVALFPIGPVDSFEGTPTEIGEALARGQTGWNQHCSSIRLWHQFELAHHVGSPRIGYPFFELNRFDKRELCHLRSQDLVLTPSKWAQAVLADHGIPSRVVPLGVDTAIFKAAPAEPKREVPSPTHFLNIGKWEVRKGHDFLLQAFNLAFRPTDNVLLEMRCGFPFLSEGFRQKEKEWEKLYLSSTMGQAGKIRIVNDRVPHHTDLVPVMQAADCGVFPARAEGWNLELLEMMACGKDVICTDYSGHTEFCNDDNSFLVPISSLEPANDGLWFHGQGEWARLGEDQMDALIEHMRAVHRKKQAGGLPAKSVGTAEQFTWKLAAKKLVEAIC